MPANFPPSGHGDARVERDGHAGPARAPTARSRSTRRSRSRPAGPVAGGGIYRVDVADSVVRAALEGPDNPLLKRRREGDAAHSRRTSTASRRYAKIVVGDEERLLRVGEWSDWVPVEFGLCRRMQLRAQCRFYLKQLDPDFVLYVSPLNLDPMAPALPISTPAAYAAELAARHRSVLHAGHARGHEGPQGRRVHARRVPAAGAAARPTKRSGSTRTSSASSPTGCSSTISGTSTRSRT